MEPPADVPTSIPLDDWLAKLGQSTGAPGGGAAAGVMLGIAASLLSMVAAYTPDDPRAAECGRRVARLRGEALQGTESDGVLSAEFGAALALPADDPDRDARVRAAAARAAESAARLGSSGAVLLRELRVMREIGNRSLSADLAVAAGALAAGLSGCSINLRANLRTARAHHAPAAALAELHVGAARLAESQQSATRIAAELSAEFDD
ncbi:cyclodeaminase/cyclohydrolase family protein [Microbacterium phyllosphaerae]|uniref:cyclodeaminase/cyclohydrolase family protein n=1 Tax=Microbacterium phyllosphaerae TaxID=124798 RepID=UPI003D64AC76